MTIKINLNPLDSDVTFPYLGRTIAYNNSNWSSLYQNLSKAQSRQGMVSGMLVKVGVTMRARALFYKAVV